MDEVICWSYGNDTSRQIGHVSEKYAIQRAAFGVSGAVPPITLPFTAASSRKPAAVEAVAGHCVAELCVAITWARAAVGKPKIPRQAPAAALPIDVLAAGALPRHLVAQRAHRALRVALACWKTPKRSCVISMSPPAHPSLTLLRDRTSNGDGKCVICGNNFFYHVMHISGFKALQGCDVHGEHNTVTGDGTGAGTGVGLAVKYSR